MNKQLKKNLIFIMIGMMIGISIASVYCLRKWTSSHIHNKGYEIDHSISLIRKHQITNEELKDELLIEICEKIKHLNSLKQNYMVSIFTDTTDIDNTLLATKQILSNNSIILNTSLSKNDDINQLYKSTYQILENYNE